MDDIKPDTIFQVSCGFMGSKLLFVANEVGLLSTWPVVLLVWMN